MDRCFFRGPEKAGWANDDGRGWGGKPRLQKPKESEDVPHSPRQSHSSSPRLDQQSSDSGPTAPREDVDVWAVDKSEPDAEAAADAAAEAEPGSLTPCGHLALLAGCRTTYFPMD